MTSPRDIIKLIMLGAIWGSSFIFMRLACPVLGAMVVTDARIILAAVFMICFCALTSLAMEWKKNWPHFLVVGLTNSAIPYFLFAYAALYIPAGYSAILNATSPFFGAVLAAWWLRDRLTFRKIVGLGLGFSGVAVVSTHGAVTMSMMSVVAIAGCLVASLCYAIVALYIKTYASHVQPAVLGAGGLSVASIVLLPFALYQLPSREVVTLVSVVSVLVLGAVCTALAVFVYYQLIKNIGPSKSLTVTFLIPIFGIVWATLFLGESITAHILAGCALIITGMYLVLRT
jgi:drug/metabolite transporter (DMT)-like permease